ncbi:MAG: FUSC family protein [Acidimicrobiales bacterium]
MNVLEQLRAHDPGFSALRRAGRAAIVMPGVFAIAEEVIGNSTIAIFSAFGALAMLLFVDFGGSMRERLAAEASLALGGAVLICLGTLVSRTTWLATVVTVVVAFIVLFQGVVSSVLAGATTALLVSFVLPVSLPGPASSIPTRLAGWLLAGAVSLIAIRILWPNPSREPLRVSTAQACTLLAQRLRSEVDCINGGLEAVHRRTRDASAAESTASVAALRTSFYTAPYRPTGLGTATRALARLVDQVIWLNSILERTTADTEVGPTAGVVCAVKLAAADLLQQGAVLLDAAAGDPTVLHPAVQRLAQAREEMKRSVISGLPVKGSGTHSPGEPDGSVAEFVSSLEPSFRAHELSFATAAVAENIELAVAARQRTWLEQLLGHQPDGATSSLMSARERARAHLERHSVWLHNSLRGAIALGLAVLVAELTGVQHAFWVVLGTLAVLRSSALNTGQNAGRALLGTGVGFVLGGGLVVLVGTDTTAYWLLLPVAVLFAGLAPATISFAAGQAGFTMALLILYNIVEPAGWKVGLVRIEDVAIGVGVSVLVGALFWPRGAGSALGKVLADALTDSARYLQRAVEYGVTRSDGQVTASATPEEERRRAAGAARRLDDAFREYLSERGTKHVPMADVIALLTGVALIRLTADAVLDLWSRDRGSTAGDRTAARNEILASGTQVVQWYEQLAQAIAGVGLVSDQLDHEADANFRLLEAVRRDLTGSDGQGTATAVRMIWTADHIDAIRYLQGAIVAPARAVAAAEQALRPNMIPSRFSRQLQPDLTQS